MNIVTASRLDTLPKQFFSTMVSNVQKVVQAGHDVINLGQGNPDLPTPPHIVESLREEILDPATHKYPPFSGLFELKAAVAQWYRVEFGVELDPQREVSILFGGKTGLVEICQCLLEPGDVCLMPDPGYPDYWSGVKLAGGEMHGMPLLRENDFLPDYSAIPKEQLAKAKMMFLNYPNNPTSAVAPLSFYEDTVRFAEQNNIVVAADFAYGAFGFDGEKMISFLQTPGAKEVGVEFYTLSKTYNMAGWRVGFAVGNADVIRAIDLIQEHWFVSIPSFIQRAAVTAITSPQDCVRELAAVYERRRDVFVGGLNKAGWDIPVPRGSFFTWVPVPKGYTSVSFAEKLLHEAHIAVAPGNGFGTHGEGYVRVGLLASEERLQEAVERILRVI
ncbi:pyridoxal phosphate-dependent aminotransferase [Tumebacillus sp. DT12]|uniref:Pyridoxal phosphate-dependent aminotransferase n=1 Tax=Tumebacillus lacus TaxID=2995335 RepID=A0ABT3WXI4_9BACL|nr:pyridoxal phosphate-dependent aminotransferase [Tumebacillus lacus]MCX7569388.1 pyridoxal phosphate-dependent aminotransferase [Tumebacillus lacus]